MIFTDLDHECLNFVYDEHRFSLVYIFRGSVRCVLIVPWDKDEQTLQDLAVFQRTRSVSQTRPRN